MFEEVVNTPLLFFEQKIWKERKPNKRKVIGTYTHRVSRIQFDAIIVYVCDNLVHFLDWYSVIRSIELN